MIVYDLYLLENNEEFLIGTIFDLELANLICEIINKIYTFQLEIRERVYDS